MAEVYSLLLGTSILNRMGIRNAIILGDSTIVIAAIVSGTEFSKAVLNNIKIRIQDNLRNMGEIILKHVLRENNTEADFFSTNAASRQSGQIRENERIYVKAIP